MLAIATVALGIWWVLIALGMLAGRPSDLLGSLALVVWGGIHFFAARGMRRGSRPAFLLTAALGVVTFLVAALATLFAVLVSASTGPDLLTSPMLGLPVVGVLSGAVSLLVLGALLLASGTMVVGGVRHLLSHRPDRASPSAPEG